MKAIMRSLSIAVTTVLIGAVPLLAEDGMVGQQQSIEHGMLRGQKDQCLIVAKSCAPDSVQRRVDRLRKEIAKGTDVYTVEELKSLNEQLRWIYTDSDNEITTL